MIKVDYEDLKNQVIKDKKFSISYIQRRYHLNYPEAFKFSEMLILDNVINKDHKIVIRK